MTILDLLTADEPNPFGHCSRGSATYCYRSSAWARTGTYSILVDGGDWNTNSYFILPVSGAPTQLYARLAIRPKSHGGTIKIGFLESSTPHVFLYINNTGGAGIRQGTWFIGDDAGSLLGSVSTNFAVNTTYLIEMYVKVHDTSGEVTVKVNGVTDTTLTGIDTKNGGTGTINGFGVSTYNSEVYCDDIAIGDNWCGAHGNYVLWPTGAGDNSGWTASTGNAYECVDADTDGTGDMTDYISDATTSDKHDFAMADLGFTPSAIGAVKIIATGTVPSGSGSARIYSISGSTTTNGDDIDLSSDPTNMSDLLGENDPDTGTGWTTSGINGLKVGVESRS